MGIENKVHDLLMSAPALKKAAKRVYQGVSVAVSRPRRSEGKIVRVTPNDKYEYLFGYYDKSPWDASGRYMLCLRVKNASREVAPKSIAEIVLIDTENNNSVKVIAKTHTWNVQQGCMAGWLGPNFNKEIFYNDCRHGKYCGVILNIKTGREKVLDMPVYTVSNDGKVALSLDFSRLHRLRPGYGYSNLKDKTIGQNVPDGPCVWRIDVKTGKSEPILSYRTLYDFEHRDDMDGAEHKVNHLMLSPDGKRFMVIHRWLKGGKKVSRLITCDIDGKNLYNLSDENMVSHCYWKNNREILAYCRRGAENGYYLMKDRTQSFERKWDFLTADGHPSYSPDGKLVVTDTYPNRKRVCTLRVLSDTVSVIIAKVYAPFKYDNDVRCDLHPRWSRDGKKICFDGCFEGKRKVYVVDVSDDVLKSGECKKSREDDQKKCRVVYVMTSCRKCGPTQQTLNIIKNLDVEKFEPVLVTIYEENVDTVIKDFLPYFAEHYTVPMSKKSIILKKNKKIQGLFAKIKPNIVHSVGVFPDYLVSSIKYDNHIFTLRNYAYEDYPAKFGGGKGQILAKMQIAAIKNTKMVITCSRSLEKMYKEKLGIVTRCIQNGVDTKKYVSVNDAKKKVLRKKLGFPSDGFLWVFTGQFIGRKNIPFMIDSFLVGAEKNDVLVLLGDGDDFKEIYERYHNHKNVVFVGNVDNVVDYLNIGDVYISASKSEGLPNSVLEAMACGLPVLLSNIPQHEELLFDGVNSGGLIFALNDKNSFVKEMEEMRSSDVRRMGQMAKGNVEENFEAKVMSRKYQKVYGEMMRGKVSATNKDCDGVIVI